MGVWDDKTDRHEVAPSGAREAPQPCLVVMAGLDIGETFRIGEKEVLIGRGREVDVHIPDGGISRNHAAIRRVNGVLTLVDLGSSNGTFVNGRRIQWHALRDGDKIRIGSKTILRFSFLDDLDARFQSQVREAALRDPLTKVLNPKYFQERFESEFRFAQRHSVPLSLILIEIDNLDSVREAVGPAGRDQVLAAIARRIHEKVRNEDVFARCSDEQFALLSRATEVEKAATLADRIRLAVAAFEYAFDGKTFSITASLGVTALPGCTSTEPEGLMDEARTALKHAQEGGRNRVYAERLPPPRTEQV